MDILKELQDLEKNHPKVYAWIKAKALLEGMTLGGVITCYKAYITHLIESEASDEIR